MSKFLRSILILSVILSLLVVAPPGRARAEAPIPPGAWTGYFSRDVKITNSVEGVLIEATGNAKADLNLNVSADGGITGAIANYQAAIQWTLTPKSLGPGGSCTFAGSWDVTGGTVTTNAAHLPVFDLQLSLTSHSVSCNPPVDGAPPAAKNSAHFEAKTFSGAKMTGAQFRFQNDMVEMVIANMAKIGAQMSIQEYWELSSSVANVLPIEPEYIQYFLAGIPFENTYKTVIDWYDSPPGTATYTLAGQSKPADDELSATFELKDLPAGKNPLVVTAIGADGQPKGSQTMDVVIVPLEPWAQKAGFSIAEKKPDEIWKVVIYRGKTYVPTEPVKLPYLDLSAIPVIGGKWGMEKPFQVVVNLEANSKGGLSNPAPVTGDGSIFLGDKDHPLKMTVDGQAVTNLTESSLLFDHGELNFKTTPVSYVRNVGLFTLIPGAAVLGEDNVFGKALNYLNSLGFGIELKVTAQAKGQGDLGVAAGNSQLIFTKGDITPSVEFSAKTGVLLSVLPVAVGGGGKGVFQIQIAPNAGLENCWVSIKLTAEAFNQKFDSPDYGIAQCKQAMLEGQKVLAVYLPAEYSSQLHQAAFSQAALSQGTTFQTAPQALSQGTPFQTQGNPFQMSPQTLSQGTPFQTQGNPFQMSPQTLSQGTPFQTAPHPQALQTQNGTILVDGAPPQATLNLATGPDGRLAFVYSTGQPGEIGLRLLDGQVWGETIRLGEDSLTNLSPWVAFDASGQLVVAWVQAARGNGTDREGFTDFFRSWEIAYAVLDRSGVIISQGSLTQDDQPDFFPQLKRSADGALWLAWLKSPSVDLWGSKNDPNWLQVSTWNGKSWSRVETVSKEILGALGFRMAAGAGSDVTIVASQDTDGDPHTVQDLEIYTYQHSGTRWSAQRLTNDTETDVFPLAAYTPDGKPALAWKRGDAVVGLEGDLKGAPVTWNLSNPGQNPDLAGGELLAGAQGELAFLWSGFTANGQGVWLVQRPSAGGDWQPARSLVDGLEGVGMLSAQRSKDGDVWIGLAQLRIPVSSQELPGLGLVSLPGLPTRSDLAVIKAARAMQPLPESPAGTAKDAAIPLARSNTPILLLAGVACLLALSALGGSALLWVRRKREKTSQPVGIAGRR